MCVYTETKFKVTIQLNKKDDKHLEPQVFVVSITFTLFVLEKSLLCFSIFI